MLDTVATSETANGGLGNALDVVAKNLPVALGAALAGRRPCRDLYSPFHVLTFICTL